MAYGQNFKNNKGGGKDSRSPKGTGTPTETKQNKTFDALGENVKNSVFQSNFEQILQMSTTNEPEKLDGLLKSIEQFAGRSKEHFKLGACVTTSQLRNVYDKVKKIKGDNAVNALKLIRPNLAYIAGREKGEEAQKFLAFLDLLIKSVTTNKQVEEFQTFFEAVVAYHRFYGKSN